MTESLNVENYKPRGVKVPAMRTVQIRERAQVVRDVLHSLFENNEPYLDIVGALERLALEEVVDYVICEDLSLFEEDEKAFYRPDKDTIYLHPETYDQACDDVPWARFTIAHELGHRFLHKSLRLSQKSNANAYHQPFEDSETQADAFAAELLADHRYILESDTQNDLMRRFGISAKSADIRFKKLHGKGVWSEEAANNLGI